MAADNEVIGSADCFDCGVEVEVRVNKNRRAYYFCDGKLKPGCGAHARWSQQASAKMIADAAKAERTAS